MNKHLFNFLALIIVALFFQACQPAPEQPSAVVPSERQLNWQDLEYYAFVHFSINTFTDKEW